MTTPAKPPTQRTRAQLELELDAALSRLKASQEAADGFRRALTSAEGELKTARAEHNNLKERLVNAEAENQRMRGYIARVQEDDTVREELIAVGDPAGEQQLVPKRKPTVFNQPHGYSEFTAQGGDAAFSGYSRRDPPKPRHWVTY